MRAAYRHEYGTPEVLSIREVPKPVPGSNEILVRVYATTVNRTDCAILTGTPFLMRFFVGLFKPKLNITGTDFAGVVESIGDGVTEFKKGDRVWGFDDMGLSSHADFAIFSRQKAILKIADHVSFSEAAASAEAAHYAYNFINKVKLQPGQKVLVNGATSAIGSALIQFLLYFNLKVAAVGPGSHRKLVESMGVFKFIDFMQEDFTRDNEKYDFVFDAVGKSSFFRCKRLLKKEGIYISSELGSFIQNPILSWGTTFSGGKKVKFPVPTGIRDSLLFVQQLTEKEKFKPIIDRAYPLENIREAYNYVASGKKIGNVILEIFSGNEKFESSTI